MNKYCYDHLLYNALDYTLGSDCVVKFTADCGEFELTLIDVATEKGYTMNGKLFTIVEYYKSVCDKIEQGEDTFEQLKQVWREWRKTNFG